MTYEYYDALMLDLIPQLTGGFLGLKAKSNIFCKTSTRVSTLDAVVCDCYGAGMYSKSGRNKLTFFIGDSDCFPSDSFSPGSVGRLCPEEADYLVDQGVGSITTNTSSVAGFTCRSILTVPCTFVDNEHQISNSLLYLLSYIRHNKQ
jgi:hypothetical protein